MMAANTPMMAMTTKSSTRVKARQVKYVGKIVFTFKHPFKMPYY